MIWIILMLTWALVIVGSHVSLGHTWHENKRWQILAGISLILSLALYYFLGYPNLPDHPYGEMVELLRVKRF
jgi:hypothetical protein